MNKILYIQVGVGFLHVNKRVIAELKKHYPGHEIELFDLVPAVKRNPFIVVWNSLVVLKEYFYDFLSNRKSVLNLKYHFLGTTFLFRYFSARIREKLKANRYEFVIQSQCLCDAGGTEVPFYIYTDHTTLNNLNYRFVSPSRYMRSNKYVELEKEAYRKASLIFVMSGNIRNSLVDQYQIPEEKIKLVYVGSNTDHPRAENPSKYNNKNIIFVGKDWTRKGGPVLLDAFKKVLQEIPDATLSIVGCKPSVTVRNCKVFGEVGLEEVAKQYEQASVFCLPTGREPFGVVFIEAMFNKLPIITNNMGAAPYLVTSKNGYLLDNDPDEYSKVLIGLLNDPDRCKDFGEESYRIARELYTWNNVGELMAKYIGSKSGEPVPPEKKKLENSLT